MQGSLSTLREAVLYAAQQALAEAQTSLAMSAQKEIQSVSWDWRVPNGTTEKRNIIDTSDLLNSMEVIPPQRNGNSIDAIVRWNPIHDGTRYAPIVHNGAKDYFQDDPGDPETKRDYVARPWTFRLVPKEARDLSQLNAIAGENPATYDETNWKLAMHHFQLAFKQYLSMKYRVVQ